MRAGDVSAVAGPGDIALFPAGLTVDINNVPDADGLYESVSIAVSLLVDQPPETTEGTRPLATLHVLRGVEDAFAEAMFAAREAILDTEGIPEAVARHRVRELVLWVERAGFHLRALSRPTTSMIVRGLIRRDPARAWASADVARRLAMSEATMRRRLASEGTSFSKVMSDTRMAVALVHLQTTDEPISQIALAVGYDNQSAFARGFRERFGHPPSAIRAEADELSVSA